MEYPLDRGGLIGAVGPPIGPRKPDAVGATRGIVPDEPEPLGAVPLNGPVAF